MRLVPAAALAEDEMRTLFNAGFSDYLVPLQLDPPAFRSHIADNDVSLDQSRVMMLYQPAAFAFIAVRGDDGWVAGMGTTPACRRRGLGERTLSAALEATAAAGIRAAWLEVLEQNTAALTLYQKLGFEVVRTLTVWALGSPLDRTPERTDARTVGWAEAHAWITENRQSPEPWQRADCTVMRLVARGREPRGLLVGYAETTTAATVFTDSIDGIVIHQIAATDEGSARVALLAAANGRALRFHNAPAQEHASLALERLGARAAAHQYEMRLTL